MGSEIEDVNKSTELRQYDILYLFTTADAIARLNDEWSTVSFTALDAGWEFVNNKSGDRCLAEVVLDGLCPLINDRLVRTRRTETTYNASILAVRPCSMHTTRGSGDVGKFVQALRTMSEAQTHKFTIGDNLLLGVPRSFFNNFKNSTHFASVRELKTSEDDEDDKKSHDEKPQKKDNTYMIISGIILVGMVGVVATNTLELIQGSLSAVFALVATGCLPQQDAFNAIKIRTVLSIVGAFGVGNAMGETHVAKVLALICVEALIPFGAKGIFAAVYFATCLLGVVFHATAVVVLMFPVCQEMAMKMSIPLHQVVAVLMMGAGCMFLSPVSYQTNLMAFASGHYTFADFPKVGFGMTVVIGIIVVYTVEFFVQDPPGPYFYLKV
jgi:hypothetical protein